MRGIINLATGGEMSAPVKERRTLGVADAESLVGFDDYVGENEFISARQRYWKEIGKQDANLEPPLEEETPVETNFIKFQKGPDRPVAVFEDDGETGYLYLYDPKEKNILQHVHSYDRSKDVDVAAEDVDPGWSADGSKCGVII
jgi:hypothetical protein